MIGLDMTRLWLNGLKKVNSFDGPALMMIDDMIFPVSQLLQTAGCLISIAHGGDGHQGPPKGARDRVEGALADQGNRFCPVWQWICWIKQ